MTTSVHGDPIWPGSGWRVGPADPNNAVGFADFIAYFEHRWLTELEENYDGADDSMSTVDGYWRLLVAAMTKLELPWRWVPPGDLIIAEDGDGMFFDFGDEDAEPPGPQTFGHHA